MDLFYRVGNFAEYAHTIMHKKMEGDMEGLSSNKNFLALGDSYTIGEAVPQKAQFAQQAIDELKRDNIIFNEPVVIAARGWTTTDLINTLTTVKLANNFDFVTLLIGVNNQYEDVSIAVYTNEFTTLLNAAIAYADGRQGRVAVLSIPDYSVTPFAANSDTAKIALEINAYNDINRRIAQEKGVTYIDITPISREAKTNVAFTIADGLHPSEQQYGRWAALLAPIIKAAL